MKELLEILKAHKQGQTMETEALIQLLEDLLDLVEIHPRSNMNFCLMGGMHELMALVFSHPADNVRKLACSIFASIN